MATNYPGGLTDKDKAILQKIRKHKRRMIELLILGDILHYSITIKQELGDKKTEEIMKLSDNKGITKGAEEFLDCLEQSNMSGIWTAFEDVLRIQDYRRLLDLMDGKIDKDDGYHVNNIRMAESYVKFDPLCLLDKLISAGVLTEMHKQKIKARHDHHGPIEATVVFFDFLRRSKSPVWYKQFMFALKDKGLNTVVDDIDPDFWSREKLGEYDDGVKPMETDQTEVKTFDSSLETGTFNNLKNKETCPKPGTSKSFNDKEMGEFNVHFSEEPGRDDLTALSAESTDPKEELRQTSSTDLSNMTEIDSDVEEKEPEVTEVLELRDYQIELAEDGMEGRNCIIVAPTGSGKTHVALKIMQNHFLNRQRSGVKKIVFLVNNVALATQQSKVCKRYLPDQRVCLLSGGSTEQLELGLLMSSYDVFVMTAQILVDAIRKESDVNFMVAFTLMIFDECHHTNKEHPYNKIMFAYMDQKLSGHDRIVVPQVIGLTASVGVGKAKGVSQAKQHILKICSNLDAEKICTVQKCVVKLRQFVSKPIKETIEVEERQPDPFKDMLSVQMHSIEQMIKKKRIEAMNDGMVLGELNDAPPNKGGQAYSQWISQTRQTVALLDEARLRRYFNTCLVFVEKYNNALIINSDVRTRDALKYLKKEFQKRDSTHYDLDKQLAKWFDDQTEKFETICNDPSLRNPKLIKLEKMISEAYEDKPDSRGIVFVKTKDLVSAICSWMKDTPTLRELRPHKLVGQSSAEVGGMTQNQQVDVLTLFKDGEHKILIATSVAEEGLDIKKCNLVIRYDYVTNVVAMMQARGRGRAEDSAYKVVATKGKGMAEREELNMIREVMMQKAIKELQSSSDRDPNSYHQQIKRLQQEAKQERDSRTSQVDNRVLHEADRELRCFHCHEMACFTSQLRVIESNHRVVIAEDFIARANVTPHSRPINYSGFIKTGKVSCKNCGHYWGTVSVYKGRFYYVIKIASFIVSDFDQSKSNPKKWKDVQFKVLDFGQRDIGSASVISGQLTDVLGEVERSDD